MKKIITILLVLFCFLVAFSCDGEDDYAYATVTVYNQSDFDVTELFAYADQKFSVPRGEELTFDIQWSPGGAFPFYVSYYLNGEFFGQDKMEGAIYSEEGYSSPFDIYDGAKVFVYIKNESYKMEGCEYYVPPKYPPSPGK